MPVTGMMNNRNVAHTRDALEELGATITTVHTGSKHYTVLFVTDDGVPYFVNVSKAPADPRKIRSWARQSYNRAAGRVEHDLRNAQNRRA